MKKNIGLAAERGGGEEKDAGHPSGDTGGEGKNRSRNRSAADRNGAGSLTGDRDCGEY